MPTVGAYEAKTHLPKLLERVSRGEKITITRHGVAVAVLTPPEQAAATPKETIMPSPSKTLTTSQFL